MFIVFIPHKIIQTVNIANLFADQKTFVDKPTSRDPRDVVDTFTSTLTTAGSTTNITFQQVVDFVNNSFRGEGLELEALTLPAFQPSPAFLQGVTDPLLKAWTQTVHSFWTQLARGTNETQLCGQGAGDCESTLIPLNHTFVVPGGRFREQCEWNQCFSSRRGLTTENVRLLGQFLDSGGTTRIRTLRGREGYAAELYGRAGNDRIHSEWRAHIL